jgi:hypothetical protein
MAFTDLQEALQAGEARLGRALRVPLRRPRSDRGQSRLPSPVRAKLTELLSGMERPAMSALLQDLRAFCDRSGDATPARATVYSFMATAEIAKYVPVQLPPPVQQALYNLAPDTPVPGHQLAFYCFNYGDLRAVSFASGLPWLALYQAGRLRGFRPKSRGLLEAVLRVRGI